jgi:signal transduction histidine kinase
MKKGWTMTPQSEGTGMPVSGKKRHHRWGKKHFRRSLMAKLLLVLLVTGCLVDFTVGGFYQLLFSHQAHAALEQNLTHYAKLLAKEMGTPPDTSKARALSKTYSLRILFHGPGQVWDSGPGQDRDLPIACNRWTEDWDASETLNNSKVSLGKVGWCRGRFFVNVTEDGSAFLFVTDFHQMLNNHAIYLALVLSLLSLVLVFAFFAIRRLLSPLKGLSEAVERLGRGELGHQVQVCSHDEIGELANSFNTMSSRLAVLAKTREQLLLDVSHELRSPLTRIKVALELAPEGADTESIRDDIREMETMISEILEAARLDSVHGKLNLEELDLGALVLEAITDASIRPPGAILNKSHFNTGVSQGPMVKVDRARIRKVLGNILDNAVKFSHGKSVPVEVTIKAEDSEAIITVRDRGEGIPAHELPNLFEPFYRVDRSRSRDTGGYGLGLSLCKRIMEAHDGSISITSQIGEGTEVSLVFPAIDSGKNSNS